MIIKILHLVYWRSRIKTSITARKLKKSTSTVPKEGEDKGYMSNMRLSQRWRFPTEKKRKNYLMITIE